MKKYSAQEVLDYIESLQQNNWWFIGQRKWSVALAKGVINHGSRLRADVNAEKPVATDLGLVFLNDLLLVNDALIKDCNLVYIFNQRTQIKIISNDTAGSQFLLSVIQDEVPALTTISPLMIKAAESRKGSHPFLFASLLGSILDCRIQIKFSPKHKAWRFHHE